MVVRIGSPATVSCEPRQARKGAAAAVDPGAGMWLVRAAATGNCPVVPGFPGGLPLSQTGRVFRVIQTRYN